MEGKLGSSSVEGVGKLEKSEEEAGRPQGGKEEKKQETEGQGKLREKKATRSATKIAPWDRDAHGMRQVHMNCQLEGYWWLWRVEGRAVRVMSGR